MTVPARCALHPARPAADECPQCGRARCRPDADQYGPRGCPVCASDSVAPTAAGTVELAVRAGLAAYLVTLFGGWIGTQYVDVHLFSIVAPALVGLASGWAVTFATTGRRWSLAIGAAGAVVSAGLAFRLQADGGQSPVASWGEVGPPYLAAVIGTLAWPVLFGATPTPNKRRQRG